jgi:hypothetical protein
MELLSRLRDNTIIFTLKQNIEKYLKNSLSPDQVQLREFRLTLHDLDFNAEKINQHISANGDCGISLRSCTVGRMEIDVAELLFDIAGVEVVVGAQANSDPRRPGAEQNAAPASRPVEIGDVNPANPYATSTGHVTALAICLVELSGLLSSYLRIVITDLRASLHFTVPYAVDGMFRKREPLLHINAYISAPLYVLHRSRKSRYFGRYYHSKAALSGQDFGALQ